LIDIKIECVVLDKNYKKTTPAELGKVSFDITNSITNLDNINIRNSFASESNAELYSIADIDIMDNTEFSDFIINNFRKYDLCII